VLTGSASTVAQSSHSGLLGGTRKYSGHTSGEGPRRDLPSHCDCFHRTCSPGAQCFRPGYSWDACNHSYWTSQACPHFLSLERLFSKLFSKTARNPLTHSNRVLSLKFTGRTPVITATVLKRCPRSRRAVSVLLLSTWAAVAEGYCCDPSCYSYRTSEGSGGSPLTRRAVSVLLHRTWAAVAECARSGYC